MPHSSQELYEKMAIESNMHNKKLGAKGEKTARKYLKRHGWKIIKKNYVSPFGEIDIIVQKGEVMAFVEVKTRVSDEYGTPSEAVDKRRKLRYISGANYFLRNKINDFVVRFDIIEVFEGQINHIENAFYA